MLWILLSVAFINWSFKNIQLPWFLSPVMQESSSKYDSVILFLKRIISKRIRAYLTYANWTVSTDNSFQTTPSHRTLWQRRHIQLVKASHETHEREVPDQPASLHSQCSQKEQDKFPPVGFLRVCSWGFLLCSLLVH